MCDGYWPHWNAALGECQQNLSDMCIRCKDQNSRKAANPSGIPGAWRNIEIFQSWPESRFKRETLHIYMSLVWNACVHPQEKNYTLLPRHLPEYSAGSRTYLVVLRRVSCWPSILQNMFQWNSNFYDSAIRYPYDFSQLKFSVITIFWMYAHDWLIFHFMNN